MTQEQLVSLIMKELDRQQIYLFDYEDLASVGIDGHLNVVELAQAITKTDTSDEPMHAYETAHGDFFIEGTVDLVALVRFVRSRS